jgi:LmbE family N-acetylglucosaminyl deacetylase
MSLDILAIAAHPDDIEQTCGGTLIRMAERGYRTGALDLTAGDMGTRGTPDERLAEAEVAAAASCASPGAAICASPMRAWRTPSAPA